MSGDPGRLRVKDFGREGMRIAYRADTVDEQAIGPWGKWLEQPPPRPQEPRPADVVLDVGAHIGGFTLLAAGLVPNGRVLAVEACRSAYQMLLRNIELNGLTNVEPFHLALADRVGEIRLHHDPNGNWGNSITKAHGGGSETVSATTLPDFFAERGVDRCDFAKFNCEGAEFQILMNTPAEALRVIRRMLIFFHVQLVDAPSSLERLERHLADAGFDVEPRQGGDTHGYFAVERAG